MPREANSMDQHLLGMAATGLVTGWVASRLVEGKGLGLLPDMVVGILGALIGGFLARFFHVQVMEGWLGALLVSVAGAVVLLVGIRLLKPSR